MRPRRLALRRESLAELAAYDLAAVAGAAATTPLGVCAGEVLTLVCEVASRVIECDSLFTPCVSSTCGKR